MSSHNRTRAVLIVALAIVLAVGPTAQAFGALNDIPMPLGVSSTNPNDPTDPEVWWRRDPVNGWGWGNSTHPQFEINTPEVPETEHVLGFIYEVDRNATGDLDESRPGEYSHSPAPNGTIIEGSLDIPGIWAYPPAGGWPPMTPGARFGYEGMWYMHMNFYSNAAVATRTIDFGFGIDVTPPAPVRKMAAKPSAAYQGPVNVWFPTTRAHVTFEDLEYDSLSGTARYHISLNGEEVSSTVLYHGRHVPRSFTIEDLPPGKNVIGLTVEDRATNRSTTETAYYYSDPDEPTVSVLKPASDGVYVPLAATFEAKATDGAGIQWVNFAIDGVDVFTDKTAPYVLAKNMGGYTVGPHTLTVTAKDMYGRTVEARRVFYVDKTYPVLTKVGDSPDPFYPMITDGYKDTANYSFYCSEGGTAVLYIYNADGSLYTSRTKKVGSGSQSITWDGKGTQGIPATGTWTYRIKVTDVAGNTGTSGTGSTTIRDYEIVRISANAVQIVPR